jgi:hypothetical protein
MNAIRESVRLQVMSGIQVSARLKEKEMYPGAHLWHSNP